MASPWMTPPGLGRMANQELAAEPVLPSKLEQYPAIDEDPIESPWIPKGPQTPGMRFDGEWVRGPQGLQFIRTKEWMEK